MSLIIASKELMKKQTQKNKAPAWRLTEIAIKKGKELSKKHNVDERLVLTSLYLAHTVFNPIWKGDMITGRREEQVAAHLFKSGGNHILETRPHGHENDNGANPDYHTQHG